METKRIYTFSVSRNPAISGYGGYDEWTIGPLSNEQADKLLTVMDKVIESWAKIFCVEGGYTGAH